MQAQFYLAEIDRRQVEIERKEDRRIARRDFRMELGIMFLIGFELVIAVWGIVLGVRQGRDDDKLMGDQTGVLQELQKSTAATAEIQKATAATLQSLQATTADMSKAMQAQLALFYDVSVNVVWNQASKRLILTNHGRTNIVLAGIKFGNEDTFIAERIIPPEGTHELTINRIDEAIAALPKGAQSSFGMPIYLKNEKNEEFVLQENLDLFWDGDAVNMRTQTLSIRPERWSNLRKQKPAR